ncbi:hypothetical protein L249_8944 [Ophiocordyceps polyrhachis-furcata BCC 54312]|uniref:Uncharacterized protein n=1 Tax=Ophiocordyceps polyrhachis-furcata BCC 54312 TaxID=1330021 RepID=A0A367L1K9_9HYPO|nr:hypothetical protein L249_8944 [Ophiocordyceps polyrhachis-furcata BCC 54312]
MPTYLCHGFRWERRKIRVFVLLHNLEEAAPDWVMGRRSAEELREQMEEMFDFVPRGGADEMGEEEEEEEERKGIQLLEEYDWNEREHATRPYAYVADYVVRVDLSVDVDEAMAGYRRDEGGGEGEGGEGEGGGGGGGGGGWLGLLRDRLQSGEEIRWYIVVCADEERSVEQEEQEEVEGGGGGGGGQEELTLALRSGPESR